MKENAGLKKVHEVLDLENKNLSTMKEQLDELRKGKIRRFFQDSFESDQCRLKREKLECQIKSKSNFIENEMAKLENAAFCDTDILTSFITRTLSIIEDVVYDQWDFRFELEDYDLIRLVAPKYACEEIARLYCVGEIGDIDDIEILDENDEEIGLILFELYDDYDVTSIYDIDSQDVPEEYDDEELRYMLLRLVELKYNNPNLSDEEAAEEVIRQITSEHSSLEETIKINIHKKV